MNYENYRHHYMTQTNTRLNRFHATADCERLTTANGVKDRAVSYVTYHEAEPCPVCHDTCKECDRVLPAGYICDDCEP